MPSFFIPVNRAASGRLKPAAAPQTPRLLRYLFSAGTDLPRRVQA